MRYTPPFAHEAVQRIFRGPSQQPKTGEFALDDHPLAERGEQVDAGEHGQEQGDNPKMPGEPPRAQPSKGQPGEGQPGEP